MPQQIYPADRTCAYCAEPLSIYFDGHQCLHCKHSHRLRPLNPLVRRVEASRRISQRLDALPKFTSDTVA